MQLALCEIYHPYFHGNNNEDSNLACSFICMHILAPNEFYNSDYKHMVALWQERRDEIIANSEINRLKHSYIRNYQKIIHNHIYTVPQLVSIFESNTGHSLCIIHTIWLKIIQRKWKKYYQQRLAYCKHPSSLHRRSILGHW